MGLLIVKNYAGSCGFGSFNPNTMRREVGQTGDIYHQGQNHQQSLLSEPVLQGILSGFEDQHITLFTLHPFLGCSPFKGPSHAGIHLSASSQGLQPPPKPCACALRLVCGGRDLGGRAPLVARRRGGLLNQGGRLPSPRIPSGDHRHLRALLRAPGGAPSLSRWAQEG